MEPFNKKSFKGAHSEVYDFKGSFFWRCQASTFLTQREFLAGDISEGRTLFFSVINSRNTPEPEPTQTPLCPLLEDKVWS